MRNRRSWRGSRKTSALRPGGLSLAVVLTAAVLALALDASTALAYTFDQTRVKDWVQKNYYKRFSVDSYNHVCTVMPSCGYRFGAKVPRVYRANNASEEAFFIRPDEWGKNVDIMDASHSWGVVREFRDHFVNHPPPGTSFKRIGCWRCSKALRQDSRWAGGQVVFYHSANARGECAADYFHSAVIYARRAESDYKRRHYGTCKVDRIGYDDTPFYCGPNFINLEDRYDQKDRSRFFVQVNTLVNN